MSFLDPYWRSANYPGRCAKCRCRFRRGERIVYVPRTRRTYCERETCGPRVLAPIGERALEEARQARVLHDLAAHQRELYPLHDREAA